MARRSLTAEAADAAARLRRLWEQKRRVLGLTQEEVALRCGWATQGSFGHYLHGRAALNIDAVLRLAKVLEVSHDEIWPGLLDVKVDVPLRVTVVNEDGATYRISEASLRVARIIESLPPEKRAAFETLLGIKGDR